MPPSSTNVYHSEPATPLLGHTLLSQPHQSTQNTPNQKSRSKPSPTKPPYGATNTPDNWDLRGDLENGFQCAPCQSETVLRSGSVTCLSRLRRGRDGVGDEDDGGRLGQLSRYLLSTHLLRSSSIPNLNPSTGRDDTQKEKRKEHTKEPNTYIIHPPDLDPFIPESILASLLTTAQNHNHNHNQNQHGLHQLTREEAISHLDAVQLLPGFDFATTAQSISNVSEALATLNSRQRQHQHQHQHRHQHRHQHQEETINENGTHRPILLIVAGLDVLAENVVRASNPVRAAAMLTTVLRSLVRLDRAYASFLSVLLVNLSGVGGGGGGVSESRSEGDASLDSSTLSLTAARRVDGAYSQAVRDEVGAGGGYHARAGEDDGGDGRSVSGANNYNDNGSGMSLFPGLLMKVLDQGVDVHLLSSTVRRVWVVEVVKDRVGGGTGKWCVWD